MLRGEHDDGALLCDHACRDVVTVRADESAEAVVHVMLDEQVEYVPVVDREGALTGICTRSDLLKVRRRQFDLERLDGGSNHTQVLSGND